MERQRTLYDAAQDVLQGAHYIYCLAEIVAETDTRDIDHSKLANLISDKAQTLESLGTELSDQLEREAI
jgi:hypothetical protein